MDQNSTSVVSAMPSWLGPAIFTALLGFLGYVGKMISDWVIKCNIEKKKRFANIIELESLLNASKDIFEKQNELARKLCKKNPGNPAEQAESIGLEKTITINFVNFNQDEQELHSLIRGYTDALNAINKDCLALLKKDIVFKTARNVKGIRGEIANKLSSLESHLYLWIAKYEAWIPPEPKHALVYLDDEEQHGKRFPTGIEDKIKELIDSGKWKKY